MLVHVGTRVTREGCWDCIEALFVAVVVHVVDAAPVAVVIDGVTAD